nr:DUF2306 domain-containing protein [Kibdelosporangium sp. MJ126-NF4]CEL14231.1 membrane protein, putative [Kibdelosporangium sp. MJ126-NF4]CTQ88599.1 membrane protein, putative [Kibdelosporangium sp. MJ126-NF4]
MSTGTVPADDQLAEPPGRATTGPSRPVFWKRPWIIPLALVVLGFLVYQLSPFRELNEAKAPIPPHDGFPLYWPLLLTHMFFGTVTMVLVVFQLWPWMRTNHPKFHRASGRIYVVSAVICGICGLAIVRFAPVVGQIGVSVATISWVAVTVTAFVRARQRKFAKHRRLMLYSFAILMNNVWGVVLANILFAVPGLDMLYIFEAVRWVGFVVNMYLVQWWIYRTENRADIRRWRRAEATA